MAFPISYPENIGFEKLRFWADNPRIAKWSIPLCKGDTATLEHKEIHEYLVTGDGKKEYQILELSKEIFKNSLADRIKVNKTKLGECIVFEGNRRLAALSLLQLTIVDRNKMPEWLKEVPCDVYINLTDDQMFHLVELWHGELKKKDWSPYSSAMMYKTRIDRDGKTVDQLSYGNSKTKAKIERQVQAIRKMESYAVTQETYFSHFDSYMMLYNDKINSIKNAFNGNEEEYNTFESKLVTTMVSSDRNTSAQTIRNTLTTAKQSKIGRKKIREFGKTGDFLDLVDWVHESGRSSDTFKTLKKITDDFYNANVEIKKKLTDPKTENAQKQQLKTLLKRISDQVNTLMAVIKKQNGK